MIILHYIPDMSLATGIVPEYVKILERATLHVATTHVVTAKELGENIVAFRKDFIHQLELINPDIVHIHACWDMKAALVERTARKKGYFTVVSPHGGLSPETMEVNFWRDKLPKILFYQLRMVRHCNMLIATTQKECEDMERLRWKRNITFIPHPLTNELSDDNVCELLMSAYRKVIDTNYRQRITVEEEMLVHQCIKVAAWPEDCLPETDLKDIAMSDISFRRLYLWTYDQNVLDRFVEGARRLEINIPPRPDIPSIPRFPVKEKVNRKEVRQFNNFMLLLTKMCGNTETPYANLEKITLQALLNAYTLLRFGDYDEDEFVRIAKQQGLTKYTKRLLARLQELFQLEQGYMPIYIP